MEQLSRKHINILLIALVVGLGLLMLKFGAWWITNSNAILSDALESIINIVAGSFALYSVSVALLPSDKNHPNGHGKIEFISAGFEGALILSAGIFIIGKAIWDFFIIHEVGRLDIGLVVTAISGLINYILGYILVKRGKAVHSITVEASGHHLKSDAYSSVGLLVGLAIVWLTGNGVLDNIVAIIFGVIIVVTGIRLVRRSVGGIMDETDMELVEVMVAELENKRKENWIDVHNLRVIKYGADLHVDCHLTLPWYFDTRKSHDEVKEFEGAIKNITGNATELFIHVDPCIPESCALCSKKDCPVRQQHFQGKVEWTADNIMTNKKHHLKE